MNEILSTHESFIKLWDNRIKTETAVDKHTTHLPKTRVLKHEMSMEVEVDDIDEMSNIESVNQSKGEAYELIDVHARRGSRLESLKTEDVNEWHKVEYVHKQSSSNIDNKSLDEGFVGDESSIKSEAR